LKNKLSRLVPSVKRALNELAERNERKKAENELRLKSKSLEEANTALKCYCSTGKKTKSNGRKCYNQCEKTRSALYR